MSEADKEYFIDMIAAVRAKLNLSTHAQPHHKKLSGAEPVLMDWREKP
ncbi:MAG: hypothetical protein ACREV1_18510 [Gammaproteobacteria bacterium]